MEKGKRIKEIERYLDDLDNLIETDNFKDVNMEYYTFDHKDMTIKDFILKGREYIRVYYMLCKVSDESLINTMACD